MNVQARLQRLEKSAQALREQRQQAMIEEMTSHEALMVLDYDHVLTHEGPEAAERKYPQSVYPGLYAWWDALMIGAGRPSPEPFAEGAPCAKPDKTDT